ncbi:MAG: 16S rRNA (uracil(1498)-N(3))-methyltransferase [Muribaculaceae bacterium]|nr:16S rRNA (uracil(1498)-N(3))-methyltransferase [Muribaculaceae bacterium]
MIQFYDPDIEKKLRLNAEESAHAVRVLRKQAGDVIYVTDGRGTRFECVLLSADSKGCPVEITGRETHNPHWPNRVNLVVAPTKHLDRMEWLIEKSVEVGVNKIIFVKCSRSERKELRIDRLQKIAVSAMKQSLKCVLPEVVGLMPYNTFITRCLESDSFCEGQRFMGYCNENIIRRSLVNEYRPGSDATLLIGPEGDFTPEEVEAAIAAQFIPVTFGETRMRTETAALYALQTIHILNQIT